MAAVIICSDFGALPHPKILKLNIQKTKVLAGIWSSHFMANGWGNDGNSEVYSDLPKTWFTCKVIHMYVYKTEYI